MLGGRAWDTIQTIPGSGKKDPGKARIVSDTKDRNVLPADRLAEQDNKLAADEEARAHEQAKDDEPSNGWRFLHQSSACWRRAALPRTAPWVNGKAGPERQPRSCFVMSARWNPRRRRAVYQPHESQSSAGGAVRGL